MVETQARLVASAAAGDENAFARIMEAHKDMVYTICQRTLGNAHDAEEAFQETFVSAFKSLGRFRGEAKLSTWLYRIALNRSRDFLASKATRQARSTSSLDTEADYRGQRALQTGDSDASLAVREAMGLLGEQYKTAIDLHCLMSYSYDEAGDIMGIPGGTVKTYVHRGKKMLGEILRQNE